jgi:hypothetical protein
MSGHAGAAIGLLLMDLGCQALVDVSQYRFDRDGGAGAAQSQPPPASDDVEEPAAGQDAGKGGAAAPVSETPPSPPLLPPRPATDGGTESSGGEQEPPPSNEPDLPPEDSADEPDAGLTPMEPEPVPDPPPMEPEPVPDPPPAPPAPPPADDDNGCSIVEYCEANTVIDTTDEERCQQLGCSVEAALAECRAEVFLVCGNVQPPFAFYSLEGVRLELQ